jgi:hypothetical protein
VFNIISRILPRFLIALVLCAVMWSAGYAQTTPPPSCTLPLDFCETAWSVSVFGNYSSMNNATTNNGFESGGAIRFSPHWSAALRYYQTASPSGKVFIGDAEYHFGIAHFIAPTSYFDTDNVEITAFAGPGIAWSSANTDTSFHGTATDGPKKFAFNAGVAVDYTFPQAPNFQLRILEVGYVRAPFLQNGGELIGNHVQVASGIKLVFGGTETPVVEARKAARKLRKQQMEDAKLKAASLK